MAGATEIEEKTQEVVTPEETFPFLKLPPEIRNEIYFFAVCRDGWSMSKNGQVVKTLQPPPIARANHQIRNEVIRMFYEENVFDICMTYPGSDRLWEHSVRRLRAIMSNPGIQFIRTLRLWFGDTYSRSGIPISNLAIDFCDEPMSYNAWYRDANIDDTFEILEIEDFESEVEDTGDERLNWEQAFFLWAAYMDSNLGLRYSTIRIGGDALDWEDRNAVESAFSEIVREDYNVQRGSFTNHYTDPRYIGALSQVIDCVYHVAQLYRGTKKFFSWRDDSSEFYCRFLE